MHKKENGKQLRTCIVTKKKYPKKQLIRIRYYKGNIYIDLTSRKEGRGCYILPDIKVYKQLSQKNFGQISKSLKIKLTSEQINYLRQNLENIINSKKT